MKRVFCAIILNAAIFFTLYVLALYFYKVQTPKQDIINYDELYSSIMKPKEDSETNKNDEDDEKFMSFFPHGDIATQYEAVRNALRIALKTNRTLIIPQLRLGTEVSWAPFPILQKYYESQDNELIKYFCNSNSKDWRVEYHPCYDINKWEETSWSTFFDFSVLEKRHKIRILERGISHGWGVNDPLVPNLKPEDVVIVDATSFPSNGTDFIPDDNTAKKKKPISSFMSRFLFRPKNQRYIEWASPEEEESLSLKKPLQTIMEFEDIEYLDQRYVQFGSLVFGLRYPLAQDRQLNNLWKDLRTNVFVSPDQLLLTTLAANQIQKVLGGVGQYFVIHMAFATLAKTEIENKNEIENLKTGLHVSHPSGQALSPIELLQQLDHQARRELMVSLTREMYGEMPINGAVSAYLPIKNSALKNILESKRNLSPKGRRELLRACLAYKKKIDKKYAIFYLTNDAYDDINAHLDVFGPFLDVFPCTFTIDDMYKWKVLESDWAKNYTFTPDENVDYNKLLLPIVDILLGRGARSFFEMPTTKLSRMISWQKGIK